MNGLSKKTRQAGINFDPPRFLGHVFHMNASCWQARLQKLSTKSGFRSRPRHAALTEKCGRSVQRDWGFPWQIRQDCR